MMLFHLLKKDFLIVKKYVLIMMLAAIIIPIFVFWKLPEYTGVLGFILSAIYTVFILLQYVSLKEYQSPKAVTLLCATPFSRKMMVLSKYVFCMAVYVVCCIIYGIETFIVSGLGTLDIRLFLSMFCAISVFIGIYLPIQYKLGYEKARFVFMMIIMTSPVIMPFLLKMKIPNLGFFSMLSPVLFLGGVVLLAFVILVVSVFLSVNFFDHADLQ